MEHPSKRRRTTRTKKLQAAKDFLLANPAASNEEVSKALGIGERTVTAARTSLVQVGMIRPAFHDRVSPRTPIIATPEVAQKLEQLRNTVDQLHTPTGPPLTPDEMRSMVAKIARNAAFSSDDKLAIDAVKTGAALDSSLGNKTRLGPGPPLTHEDRLMRTSIILDVAGPALAAHSCRKAFSDADFNLFLNELSTIVPISGRLLVTETQPNAPREALVAQAPSFSPASPESEPA